MMMTSGTALYCKKEAEHAVTHVVGTDEALLRMGRQWRRRPACE